MPSFSKAFDNGTLSSRSGVGRRWRLNGEGAVNRPRAPALSDAKRRTNTVVADLLSMESSLRTEGSPGARPSHAFRADRVPIDRDCLGCRGGATPPARET